MIRLMLLILLLGILCVAYWYRDYIIGYYDDNEPEIKVISNREKPKKNNPIKNKTEPEYIDEESATEQLTDIEKDGESIKSQETENYSNFTLSDL